MQFSSLVIWQQTMFCDITVHVFGEAINFPCLYNLISIRSLHTSTELFVTRSECLELFQYGFECEDDEKEALLKFEPTRLKQLSRSRKQWTKYLQQNTLENKSKTLKSLMRGGVPPELRGMIWYHVSGAKQLEEANVGVYEHLLTVPTEPCLRRSIQLDVPRMYPNNPFFKSHREELEEVLEQYAKYNPKIGYRVGMI
jgi:hypothetical protein